MALTILEANIGTTAPVDGGILKVFRQQASVANLAIIERLDSVRQRTNLDQLFKNA